MSLAKLIRERLDEQDLSYRRAAARSNGLVSYSTLAYIVQGKHTGNCDDETLRGIALALALPVSRVRREAGRPDQEPPPFQLPDAAKYLSPQQRKAVLVVINGMLSSQS